MSAFLYIIQNLKGMYYVGATEDLNRRLSEHDRGQNASTRGRGPWTLVYKEEYLTFIDAHTRERQIKRKRRRSYIDWLVENKK
jgi:putative endonuclease